MRLSIHLSKSMSSNSCKFAPILLCRFHVFDRSLSLSLFEWVTFHRKVAVILNCPSCKSLIRWWRRKTTCTWIFQHNLIATERDLCSLRKVQKYLSSHFSQVFCIIIFKKNRAKLASLMRGSIIQSFLLKSCAQHKQNDRHVMAFLYLIPAKSTFCEEPLDRISQIIQKLRP